MNPPSDHQPGRSAGAAPEQVRIFAMLAYGSPEYRLEARLALLSMLRWLSREEQSGLRVIVFTDQPEAFHGYPASFVRVDASVLSRWRGEIGYVHRQKIVVMQELLDEFRAPVLLVDTDTIFTGSPSHLYDRISPGSAVMHKHEGSILDSPEFSSTPLRSAFPLGNVELPAGTFTLDAGGTMWNSGVLGLHPEHRPLLDVALALCDRLYEQTGAFNTEQFATGQVLASTVEVHPADDVVYHYWNAWVDPRTHLSLRGEVHAEARRFLDAVEGRPFEERLRRARHLRIRAMASPTLIRRIIRRGAALLRYRREPSPAPPHGARIVGTLAVGGVAIAAEADEKEVCARGGTTPQR
jgi:hypothetical protein